MAGKYSKEQIVAYYDRIAVPPKDRVFDIANVNPKDALSYLKLLQKRHLISIPFENLVLHYSPHRSVILHHDELFRKIVTDRRGGYCMELNATFGTLLRSLGYTLYNAGARVYEGTDTDPSPWSHMLAIVTVGDSRYLVDVGFGSNYVSTQPIRLVNDTGGFTNVAPASARLVFKAIDGASNPYHKLWVYQHKTGPEAEWRDMYCFAADLEFRAPDFEMMNWWTSTSRRTIFTQKVICNKLIMGEDGEIVGTLGLMRELKKRVGKDTQILVEFEDEKGRVQALKEHFGIELSGAEREAIKGTSDEIK